MLCAEEIERFGTSVPLFWYIYSIKWWWHLIANCEYQTKQCMRDGNRYKILISQVSGRLFFCLVKQHFRMPFPPNQICKRTDMKMSFFWGTNSVGIWCISYYTRTISAITMKLLFLFTRRYFHSRALQKILWKELQHITIQTIEWGK